MEKKILHVIGRYPKGGVGSFLKNINANIDLSKIRFDYLVNDSKVKTNFEEKVTKYNSGFYVLPRLSIRKFGYYLKELDAFYKKNNNYTAIHIHSVNLTLFNYYYAKKNGIKNVIVHSHSTKSSDVFFKRIRNFFLIAPVKIISSYMIACNYDSGRFLFGEKKVKSSKFTIIRNAIDTQAFLFNKNIRNEIRNEFSWEDKLVIGHVGHMIPVKNHFFILEIFKEIKNRNKDAVLVLIGEGELKTKIQAKAEELDVQGSIYILGSRDDIQKFMQAFDIFILPSKFEGIPLVSIEAQAAGLPCFLSKNISKEVAITDLVEFLKIDDNQIEWADKILKWKGNSNRYMYSKKVIAAGYDIRSEAKRLESFYLEI